VKEALPGGGASTTEAATGGISSGGYTGSVSGGGDTGTVGGGGYGTGEKDEL
jgi:hypothetical protein